MSDLYEVAGKLGSIAEILEGMQKGINWNIAMTELVDAQERQAKALEKIAKALEDGNNLGHWIAFGEDPLAEIEDTAVRVMKRVGFEEVET